MTSNHHPTFERGGRELDPSVRSARELAHELHALRVASPDIVAVIDAQGSILEVSAADAVLGLFVDPLEAPEQLVGRHVGELLPPTARRPALSAWRRALTTGAVQELTFTLELAGQPRHLHVRGKTFGDPPRIAVHVRDVTRERQMQERLLAIQRFEGMALLVSALSHDFSNLLTGIIGNAELARLEAPRGGVSDEALADVVSSARRAAELCHQLCGISGKRRTSIDFVNLSDLANQMLVILRTSIGPRIQVVRELAPSESMPVLIADDAQLRQIVLNLLAGAADSLGDEGGVVTVRTGVVEADMHGDAQWVFLEIEDTGRALDATTRQRLLDPSAPLPVESRALGLAATVGIVRGHGGVMTIDPALRGGSRVRVLLPLEADAPIGVTRPEPAADVLDPSLAPAAPSTPVVRREDGGLVLLVSSDHVLVATCRDAFERSGHRVQHIASAAEALIALRAIAPLVRGVVVDADTTGPEVPALCEHVGALVAAPSLVVGGTPPIHLGRGLVHAPRPVTSDAFGRGLARMIAHLAS